MQARWSSTPHRLRVRHTFGTFFAAADDAISARRFGEIKPPVGAFEQAVVIGGVVRAGGKPDADSDERRGGFGIHVAGDVAADALAERMRRGPRHVRHDDDEFLAAEAEHGVVGADRAHHDAGDAQQHHVAGGMAEAVVEALEVIDVENEQAERPAGQRRLVDAVSALVFSRPRSSAPVSASRPERATRSS